MDGQRNAGERFRDPMVWLQDFEDEILVRCPACDACALVLAPPKQNGGGRPRAARLCLRCPTCGLGKDASPSGATYGGPFDPYFQLPLWLQAECCGEVLWAYNAEHLDLLESYVGAKLRERGLDRRWSSMLERLPTWIKSAKNRDEVLRGIERLHTLQAARR
jgi:hypothetical protein